jgi:hypothetical protein
VPVPVPVESAAPPPAEVDSPAPPPMPDRSLASREHIRFAARRRAVRAVPRAGRDFLERQGGIY